MNPEWLSTIVASVALVISLAVAVQTWRLGQRTMHVMTYQGATDLTLDLDRVFLDQPQLRPYFYDGEPTPPVDHPEHHRVLAAAEFCLDVCECIWDHRTEYDEVDKTAWREWIHHLLSRSPALCQLYREQPEWYPAIADLVATGECDLRPHHDALFESLTPPAASEARTA
ncbi:MAG TPA: hypothetical protein VLJ59_11400 [Mycobacteriales bacterium]|nr:hypothetical protein [Mycobacteriales bacterium]